MRKVKLFSAVCLALFAGMLMAAPEPSVPAAKTTIDTAQAAVQKAVPASTLTLPYGAQKIMTSSDALFGWYVQPSTGMRYLVYEWPKPGIVNSLTIAANQKVTPGREMMVVVPEGRSKGKVKIDISAKIGRASCRERV